MPEPSHLRGTARPEEQCVLIWILEDEHPTHQQRNGLLRGNAEKRAFASDSRDLTSGPTPARVIVVSMRVEEEQILLDSIKPQQCLRIPV